MELRINQKAYQVEAEADTPLLWVIRDNLGMTGTKYGCGLAQCGACSVLVDGNVVRSCVTPVAGVVGREITTIEAIEADDVGKHVVQAWVEHQVAQCGYCQSGQVMAATALLRARPHAHQRADRRGDGQPVPLRYLQRHPYRHVRPGRREGELPDEYCQTHPRPLPGRAG